MAKRAGRAAEAMAALPAARMPLAPAWRTYGVPTWRVWAMLSKIPDAEYDAVAAAFEAHHRRIGTLSADWLVEWKAWCRQELHRRAKAPAIGIEPDSIG